MRKILLSLMVIGIAATMLGAGTMSYFSDSEISAGNTFAAGAIDLKINVHSTHMQTWPCHGTQDVEQPIIFGEKDLVPGDHLFYWHDIKPGDFGEATISIHVYSNDAWLWMRFVNVVDNENDITDPEQELDDTAPDGELSQNIQVMLWVDQGVTPGFGNDDKEFGCGREVDGDCIECPPPECWGGEGDNIWQKRFEPVLYVGTMYDLLYNNNPFFSQHKIRNCTTYYIGWSWRVPPQVGNIIQTDSLVFDIEFYAQQWRNNPNPVNPWPPGP